MSIGFTFKGQNEVSATLKKFAQQFPDIVDRAMGPWAKDARNRMKARGYPRKNTEKWNGRWASEKQRRYVMAAIRRGDIKVPYRRTGNLANRWASYKVRDAEWVITNRAPYSVYVVGQREQQHKIFHAGRWWIAFDELGQLTFQLVDDIADEIQKEWLRNAIAARGG